MMKKKTRTAAAELRRRIDDLIEYTQGNHNRDLVADIVENALKLLDDVEHRGDVRIIQTAMRELRYAFKQGRQRALMM